MAETSVAPRDLACEQCDGRGRQIIDSWVEVGEDGASWPRMTATGSMPTGRYVVRFVCAHDHPNKVAYSRERGQESLR